MHAVIWTFSGKCRSRDLSHHPTPSKVLGSSLPPTPVSGNLSSLRQRFCPPVNAGSAAPRTELVHSRLSRDACETNKHPRQGFQTATLKPRTTTNCHGGRHVLRRWWGAGGVSLSPGTGNASRPSPLFPRPMEAWFSTFWYVLGWVVWTRARDQGWGQG